MISPRSIGKLLNGAQALIIPTVTAGAAGDGLEVNGLVIDRQDAHSAKLFVASKATLAAAETLTVQVTIQDGDAVGGGDMADNTTHLAAAAVVTTLTGGGGGTTETGLYELALDLSSYKRYVRVQIEPTLSASGTDVATVAAVLAMAGLTVSPAGSV